MKTRCTIKNLAKILQLLAIAAIFIAPVFAGPSVRPAAAAPTSGPALPVSALLNPDGTINLNTGYRGSLDLKGWKLVSNAEHPLSFAPQAAGDGHWDDIFGRPGVNNAVNALAVDGAGNLYAGGNFTTAGNVIASYIAMWDGSAWSAVGGGLSAQVNALTIGPDGFLYVGGYFQNAGGVPEADRIAVWNGSAWLALGTGFGDRVNALAFDSTGNLYAGGSFTNSGLNRIAMWNGSAWTALGSGFPNGLVNALAIDGNDLLYAGGSFTDAAGDMDYIAQWNGSSWSAVATGLNNQVNAFALSGTTDLYVGGNFTDAGGNTSADHVVLWSGGTWNNLGPGITNNTVYALAMNGTDLLVGGNFVNAGDNPAADRIAVWDGGTWGAVEAGLDNTVRAITVTASGFYVGGDFALASAVVADRVVFWNGSAWNALGSGNGFNVDSDIYTLLLDGQGNLYAGGDFTYAGSTQAARVAKWDGSTWSVLGSGMSGIVYSLLLDANGVLYAGGNFATAGGWTVNNVAKWDGTDWYALGSPPNVGVGGGHILSMIMDASGNLYVAGAFTSAGGQPANRVAKWDGSTWTTFGSGFDNTVNIITLDQSGNLYAGGNFLNSGGSPVSRLAMWDGSTWSAVGGGVNNQVFTLLFDENDNLYLGGSFTDAGGVPNADRIAMWDGSTFSGLGTGINSSARDLAFDSNGTLIVSGEFNNAGGVAANRIARWNGVSWTAMGSGTNNTVFTIAVESDWSIFVGGSFTTAGDKGQAYIARWFNTQPVAVDDSYTTPEEQTLVVTAPGVLGNDSDPNDDAVTSSVVVSPSVGTLAMNIDGSFVYTPVLNYDEDVTFTYQIVDQYGGADEAMVTISVQGINDAPVAVNDNVFTFEDVSISIPALENDFDVDEDVLSIDSITGPFHGTAVISGTTEIFYDPDPGYIGSDSFYYIVYDGVLTDTGTIYITIDETNDPPEAVNDSYTTSEDTVLNVAAPGVLANDFDQEMLPLTAVLDGAPAHGEVTLNADGSFTYVPAADYVGSDSFTYVANDGYSDSNVATVYINITPVNDAPVAVEDTYYVLVDGSLTVSAPGVLGNDTDLEGDSLTAALDASPSHGTVTLYGNGSFVYTPNGGYLGTDTFTYSVSDGHGGVSTGTVVINVVEELPALFMYVPMVAKH